MSDFWKVMFFYAFLSCFLTPMIFSYFKGPSGLGLGYVIGSVVSVILWFVIGYKYAGVPAM